MKEQYLEGSEVLVKQNRQKVIARIETFRELTKAYSRAKGLNYSKDAILKQTITVINNFKDGAYQIQNSSRQAVLEAISKSPYSMAP
jgi:hypothetical protein